MKTFLLIALFSLPLISLAQTKDNMEEMGLKQYMFVMYTTGPNRTQDSATAAQIQAGHLKHIDSLAKIGVLNVAGPFLEDHNWRGILIFDIATKEEAEALVKEDPAVQAGRLSYVILPWMTKKGNTFN